MKRRRPELGLERLLAALEQDLLSATDEEILDVATEMGLKPDMKGSIALAGVTFTARMNFPGKRKQVERAKDSPRPSRRNSGRDGEI